MSITSKVRQSVVLTADGQVQKLISGSAANITKASILSIFVQSTAADGEVKLYNEIGSAKTAGKLIFHGKFGAGDNAVIGGVGLGYVDDISDELLSSGSDDDFELAEVAEVVH